MSELINLRSAVLLFGRETEKRTPSFPGVISREGGYNLRLGLDQHEQLQKDRGVEETKKKIGDARSERLKNKARNEYRKKDKEEP